MMDVMSVEKHIDSTFEGGKGEKLWNIHFLAFLAVDIFYISNDDFKRTEGPFWVRCWRTKVKFLKDKWQNWIKKIR